MYVCQSRQPHHCRVLRRSLEVLVTASAFRFWHLLAFLMSLPTLISHRASPHTLFLVFPSLPCLSCCRWDSSLVSWLPFGKQSIQQWRVIQLRLIEKFSPSGAPKRSSPFGLPAWCKTLLELLLIYYNSASSSAFSIAALVLPTRPWILSQWPSWSLGN